MLKKVDFGNCIAEKDSDMLDKAFIETPYIKDALLDEKRLIVGRKGVGKSAIVEHLKRTNGDNCLVFRPRDLRFTEFQSFYELSLKYKDLDSSSLLQYVWEIIILGMVMGNVTSDKYNLSPEAKTMRAFYSQYGNGEEDFIGRVLTYIEKSLRNAPAGVKIISDILSHSRKGKDIDTSFKKAKEALKNYLSKREERLLVLIDNIDERWVSENAISTSIIKALVQMTRELSPYEFSPNLIIKCFIPMDMAEEALQTRHEDKTYPEVCEIKWTRDTLLQLIGARIAISCNLRRGKDFITNYQYCWERIFSKSGYNLLGKFEESFDYILRHTLYRPRDIIRYCDHLVKETLKQDENSDLVPFNLIQKHLVELAKDSIRFLKSEFNAKIEKKIMEEIITEFVGLSNILTYDDFIAICEICTKWKKTCTQNEIANLLYEIGFIGAILIEPTSRTLPKPSRKFVFSFAERDQNLRRSVGLCIHPLFYEYLSIEANTEIIVKGH